MLLLRTAGFACDSSDEHDDRPATDHGQPGVVTSSRASLRTPLLSDPGEQREYGSDTDWAGLVVEGVAGRRPGDVVTERVLAPLGCPTPRSR